MSVHLTNSIKLLWLVCKNNYGSSTTHYSIIILYYIYAHIHCQNVTRQEGGMIHE